MYVCTSSLIMWLFPPQERVGELESAVSTKSKLEVRVQVLQEVSHFRDTLLQVV